MAGVEPLLARALPDTAAQIRSALAPLWRRTDCARAETLLVQGERWRDALLIEHGLLRLCFVRRDGRV